MDGCLFKFLRFAGCFIVRSHANCSNYETQKNQKQKLISTFHLRSIFLSMNVLCCLLWKCEVEVFSLKLCLLLLLKFFYIFEDRRINRGRIYASQPPQEGERGKKNYPAFVSSSHTALEDEETDERLRHKREELRQTISLLLRISFRKLLSNIIGSPESPHIDKHTRQD